MDPTTHCSDPTVSPYAQLTTNHGGSRRCNVRKRFEKSESEDSGVELPPPSPFGSESSYNPDESESLESSTPEYSESLKSITPEVPESPKSMNIESQDSLAKPEETAILDHLAVKDTGSFNMESDKDIDTMEHFFNQQRERDMTSVPHQLEQAILRSRRRSTSRESIQNRTSRYHRQYVGSLKEQRRGKTFTHQAKSPTRQSQDQDPLILPGDGLRYLESLCQMLEQIAELQEKNQSLQKEKREAEGRLHKPVPVLFLDSCVCGASRACKDSDNDVTDNPLPVKKVWEQKHYRKRSSSHAGVLFSIARPTTDKGLKPAVKMDPRYVSVPNLQEKEQPKSHQNYKAEVSQWHKVKDMLSKLARKGVGPVHGSGQMVEPRNNCRTQTILEGNPQHPKRLFLPGLVIRPHNHGRQFH
ncbi:uncharacterized protein C8orf58 homolog isoform 2-T3 [Anomaloglossus baeobatrachus]